jgi:hypothetical protein
LSLPEAAAAAAGATFRFVAISFNGVVGSTLSCAAGADDAALNVKWDEPLLDACCGI